MHYLKRKWDETRGDQYDHWGNSMWYFETDKYGKVSRQVEEYTIGIRLRYDTEYTSNMYGMLSNAQLELSDSEFEVITVSEFEKKWAQRNPSICQTIDDENLTLEEIEEIEICLPLSNKLYDEIWSTGLINKLEDLPMKNGPIQDIEETILLNEGLATAVEIFEANKSKFSEAVSSEFDSVVAFIKEASFTEKDIQFWL